jgi:hypothetical protein
MWGFHCVSKGRRWFAGRGKALSALLVGAASMPASLAAGGCGSEDEYVVADTPPAGRMQVTVEYPSDEAAALLGSVHLWVLRSEGEATGQELCDRLVGGNLEPHDLSLEQVGEVVETDLAVPLVARGLDSGRVLAYVEAVDYRGETQLAGCAAVRVTDGEMTEVELRVGTAGVYRCEQETTPDGAPCDDGQFCTEGERCLDGECQGGSDRSCSHLSVGCVRGVCDEAAQGCVTVPIEDGGTCNDGLFCTVGETCQGGVCAGGAPLDCSQEARPCEVATACDEALDQCQFGPIAAGTSCDDGLACTEDDQCDGAGTCSGTPLACEGLCHTGSCDPDSGTCVNRPAGSLCGDRTDCASQCDASGSCVDQEAADGTACDDGDPDTTEDQCVAGECTG